MHTVIKIYNNDKEYIPCVAGEVMLELERKGSPGKLTFDVVKDPEINFQEGNLVTLTVDGVMMFHGYVFKKKRSKANTIGVTAYDQIRYLKNKDTINEGDKTVADLIRKIAGDFALLCGELEDTGVVLPSILGDNQTLLDTIQEAIELTMESNGKIYVLYDHMGRLTLRHIGSMKSETVIDAGLAADFDYESSIDDQTYTRIKITYDDDQSGARMKVEPQNPEDPRILSWGVLQYMDKADTEAEAATKAKKLLELYGQKTRKLTIRDVKGDLQIRGGSLVPVNLNLGDIITQNCMLTEKVKHIFRENQHTMDLNLSGGEFVV